MTDYQGGGNVADTNVGSGDEVPQQSQQYGAGGTGSPEQITPSGENEPNVTLTPSA